MDHGKKCTFYPKFRVKSADFNKNSDRKAWIIIVGEWWILWSCRKRYYEFRRNLLHRIKKLEPGFFYSCEKNAPKQEETKKNHIKFFRGKKITTFAIIFMIKYFKQITSNQLTSKTTFPALGVRMRRKSYLCYFPNSTWWQKFDNKTILKRRGKGAPNIYLTKSKSEYSVIRPHRTMNSFFSYSKDDRAI